ncbi:hypothetical protein [Vitreimonas flagellata]|uniref:hypothetical protein n=1 Tax=Vitreimonas flagellata TaxID=2560861 RepID=UPI00142F8AE7|nr:hypothetical protein [Vitreimonas flagellata]
MAKTIGSFETIAAVQAAFAQELDSLGKKYKPSGKWDKAYGFQSSRLLGTFLGAVAVRLRQTFKPHANKLKLEPDSSELASLYAQTADQTVFWAHSALNKVLSVNTNAKVV